MNGQPPDRERGPEIKRGTSPTVREGSPMEPLT